MKRKLSPEFLVAGFIRSATNGRVISARLRRVLTLIIFPLWLVGLFSIAFLTYDLISTISDNSIAKEELSSYYKSGYHSNDAAIYSFSDNRRTEIQMNEFSIKEIIEIMTYIVLGFILPWVILKTIFWVIDAERVKIENGSA